jgi:hypothetical protein
MDLADKAITYMKMPLPVGSNLQNRRQLSSNDGFVLMSLPLDNHLMAEDNLVLSAMYSQETYNNETL